MLQLEGGIRLTGSCLERVFFVYLRVLWWFHFVYMSLRLVIKVGCMCITNILWLDKSLWVCERWTVNAKKRKITQFVATVAISILSFVLFSNPSDSCAGLCFLGRVLCLQVWSLCSWRCCLRLCIPVCCNPNDTSLLALYPAKSHRSALQHSCNTAQLHPSDTTVATCWRQVGAVSSGSGCWKLHSNQTK